MANLLYLDRNSNSPKTQELGCEDMGARRNGVPQIADSEGQLATSHWTRPYMYVCIIYINTYIYKSLQMHAQGRAKANAKC